MGWSWALRGEKEEEWRALVRKGWFPSGGVPGLRGDCSQPRNWIPAQLSRLGGNWSCKRRGWRTPREQAAAITPSQSHLSRIPRAPESTVAPGAAPRGQGRESFLRGGSCVQISALLLTYGPWQDTYPLCQDSKGSQVYIHSRRVVGHSFGVKA